MPRYNAPERSLSKRIDDQKARIDTLVTSGPMTSFDVDANEGTAQTITNGNTLTVVGGTGIDTTVGPTDNVTVAIDEANLNTKYLRLDATNDPMTGDLNMGDKEISDIKQLILDTTPATPGSAAGTIYWNETEFTINIVTGLGPVLQVGQEIFFIVFNDTVSQIDDGKVVHPVGGATSGHPHIELAQADVFSNFDRAVWVATMDIPAGEVGIATELGRVRGINTNAFTVGDNIYLSATTAGEFTATPPEFPSYRIQIGGVAVKDPTDGEIVVSVLGEATDDLQNFWNGVLRESFDFRVTSSGTVITGTLTPTNGHPDMTLFFSSGRFILDTDPGATVTLTAGTDTNPQENFVYILESDPTTIVTSTGDWPATEHAKVALLYLQSAASIVTVGAFRNQNWNDHIQSTVTSQGHLSHIGERIRAIEAEWWAGAETSLTGTTANVFISNTSGKVYQMHLHDFPAIDMSTGDDIHVVNDPVSAFRTTSNLNDLTVDADGDTLNNRWFSIVVWGVANKTGELSHLMCDLPTGSYTSENNAVNDALGYAVYSVPKPFKGVGFLLARFTMRKTNAVFTFNPSVGYQDLRGFIPNSTAGSGAGSSGITTFLGLTDVPSSYAGEAGKVPAVNGGETALEFTDIADNTAVSLNTDHRTSNGTDHANVVLNDTHRASDGKNHSDVVLNNTHRSSDGSDHSKVTANETAIGLNTTHRGSDGKDHSDVVTNNAKVTNATHTGEVTGDGVLTVDKTAITNKSTVTAVDADFVLISDTSDGGELKKALKSDFGGGGGGVPIDGWIDPSETWTFASVDDPTGVITVPSDATTKYSVGMRLRFVNGGNTIYGIITVVTSTTITFLHEIDPTDGEALHLMANSAITANFYSTQKTPFDFPLDPASWTVYSKDTTNRTQTPPTSGVWYNLGSFSITVPIGVWSVIYSVKCILDKSTASPAIIEITLSTANNSESNAENSCSLATAGNTNGGSQYFVKLLPLAISTKDVYFINTRALGSTLSVLFNQNADVGALIQAVCAYL
jgi:hypothetical protein